MVSDLKSFLQKKNDFLFILAAAAPQRNRRSTNETSIESDDGNTGVSVSVATFVLKLVVNVAYLIYNLVISDFGTAANYALSLITVVLQYVFK